MKKSILVLSSLFLLACNTDNGENNTSNYIYNASIKPTCSGGTSTTYEVTKTTYDNLNEYLIAGGTCQLVNFKDISKITHNGYLVGIGRSN